MRNRWSLNYFRGYDENNAARLHAPLRNASEIFKRDYHAHCVLYAGCYCCWYHSNIRSISQRRAQPRSIVFIITTKIIEVLSISLRISIPYRFFDIVTYFSCLCKAQNTLKNRLFRNNWFKNHDWNFPLILLIRFFKSDLLSLMCQNFNKIGCTIHEQQRFV